MCAGARQKASNLPAGLADGLEVGSPLPEIPPVAPLQIGSPATPIGVLGVHDVRTLIPQLLRSRREVFRYAGTSPAGKLASEHLPKVARAAATSMGLRAGGALGWKLFGRYVNRSTDEAIELHPLFAFDRIPRNMTTPAKTIAMICITTYPAGVARNSLIDSTVFLTDSRCSSRSPRILHPCSSTSRSSRIRRSSRNRLRQQQHWLERVYRPRMGTGRGDR